MNAVSFSLRYAVAMAFVVAPILPGCTWLARYERAIASNRIPANVAQQAKEPTDTAETSDVHVAFQPRQGFIAQSSALSPQDALKSFTLAPGFEVQLVASEPNIQKPMQLAFDERGRLLVSTSTDYPMGPVQGRKPADKVMLLEIDGATGAATKITTFAEGFNICSGLESLPGGGVVLAHAPDILLLTDTDGDGKADTRDTLYTGFARDDTHEIPNSFTWGIDGWLYGLQGHVNVSNVRDKSGRVTPIRYGNVYRMRADGSQIEVWARGMSNPWGLTFDQHQNMYAADCESRPIWQIVQGLPYQGFQQPVDPLGFAPYITEDPHGASGFAGLVCYTDDAYPAAYRDCLFLGNPITGRIHRDRPTFSGATHPLVRRPDLLISSDPWFRPVDIELGPDGALYVADWYNRVIAHVEVPLDHPDRDKSRGRIWRIVYRGDDASGAAKQFDGPMARDWSTLGRDDLLAALAEPNAWMRRMAAAQLRARFADDASAPCRRMVLGKASSPTQRMEAVWLLQSLGALPQPHAEALLHDPDPWIRREAVRIVAASPETPSRAVLLATCLSDSSPYVVREAAMALRITPSESSFRAILDRARNVPAEDTLLRYALRFSARDHLFDNDVIAAVEKSMNTQQFGLDLQELLAATPSTNAARILERQLSRNELKDTIQPLAIESIFANGDTALLQTFMASSGGPAMAPAQTRSAAAALFKNRDRIAKLGIDPAPYLSAWTTGLVNDADRGMRYTAMEIAAELDLEQATPLAREIVRDRSAPPNARERATRLLMRRDAAASAATVRGIIADPAEPVAVRRAVAREYAKYVNDAAGLTALAKSLKTAPLDVYGGAVESLATRKPGVFLLLDAVENQTIGAAYINNHVTRIRIEAAHKDPQLTARYDRLVARAFKAENEGLITAHAATLRETFLREPNRDPHNGRRVFEENCVKCHRLAGNGALIGPNLDGLANRGIERVLQDIATPSLDIDPAFLTTLLSLADGENLSGLVVRENETQLVLADTQGQERSIPKSEIVERTKFPLSPMPAGFITSLPEKDFLDLLGFLLHPQPARAK